MMTNEQLVIEYLDWLKNTKGRSGVTVYNYSSTLVRYVEHVGQTPLANVSLATMETYVRRPRGGRAGGRIGSPSSQAKDVAIIRALYAYLMNRGHVQTNPAALLGGPKVHNQNPRPIPDHEWRKLWDACESGAESVAIGLGFFAGLRRREVCELRTSQVFVPGLRLVSFTRKGGGDDVLPYGDCCEIIGLGAGRLVDELDAYTGKRMDSEYLIEWGEQVPASQREATVHALPAGMTDPGLFNRRMRKVCERADVGPYTPHQLRHSFVTNLLRRGVPLHLVQRMANHSSPAITSRYIKAGASELREWMATVNRHG